MNLRDFFYRWKRRRAPATETPPLVMLSTPEARLEELIRRWNLKEYCLTKSITAPVGCRTVEDVRRLGLRYEQVYQEVPPQIIIETCVPDKLVTLLLNTDFQLKYSNSTFYSEYNPRKNKTLVNATSNILHEIGHALWYILLPPEEAEQKRATIESLDINDRQRKPLPPDKIPSMHKMYAALIGAYSGQFLLEHHPDHRTNDVEEHFARTFNSLMKGEPLAVLPTSNASIEDCISFYRERGVVDDQFVEFYRLSLRQVYGGQGLRKVSIEKMNETPISTETIKQVEKLKHLTKEVSLRHTR